MPTNHLSRYCQTDYIIQIKVYVYSELLSVSEKNKPEKETVHISGEILSPTCLNARNAFNCATKFWENKPRAIGIQ